MVPFQDRQTNGPTKRSVESRGMRLIILSLSSGITLQPPTRRGYEDVEVYKNEQQAVGNTIVSNEVEPSQSVADFDSDDELWANETQYYKEFQKPETTHANQDDE